MTRAGLRLLLCCALLARSEELLGEESSPEERARHFGYAGVAAFNAGDYSKASEQLEQAYATLRVPSLGLWSARALERQGKLLAARDRLQEAVALPLRAGVLDVQRAAQADARADLIRLLVRIPTLQVKSFPCPQGLDIYINGELLTTSGSQTVPVDPGQYELRARCGLVQAQASVQIAIGQRAVVTLRPSPTAALARSAASQQAASGPRQAPMSEAGSSASSSVGWITAGVGVATLSVAVVASALALERLRAIRQDPRCSADACSPEAAPRVEAYSEARSVAVLSAAAGGLLVAIGATLVVVGQPSEPRLAAALGAGDLKLYGAF